MFYTLQLVLCYNEMAKKTITRFYFVCFQRASSSIMSVNLVINIVVLRNLSTAMKLNAITSQ